MQSFGVPSADVIRAPPPPTSAAAVAPSRRLDALPLVSRVSGMLRSLRFNVAAQRIMRHATAAAAASDVNDNDKVEPKCVVLHEDMGVRT